MDYNKLFEICYSNNLESEQICKYIVEYCDFNNIEFLRCLKNIFIHCHFSYRKLLSLELLLRNHDNEIVSFLFHNKYLSTRAVRTFYNINDYTDIDDSIRKYNFNPYIIIYNK